MAWLRPGGNCGTTNNAVSRPAPSAGKIFKIVWLLLTVLIINSTVRPAGNSKSNSLVALAVMWAFRLAPATIVTASLPLKRTSTSPKHKAKKTKAAFTRSSTISSTGTSNRPMGKSELTIRPSYHERDVGGGQGYCGRPKVSLTALTISWDLGFRSFLLMVLPSFMILRIRLPDSIVSPSL